MTTPETVIRAGTALDGAFARVRDSSRATDPHTLIAAGRLHIRLEAIRALSAAHPETAGLLAEDLIDAIDTDLNEKNRRAAAHATTGAALLGVT